MSKSFTISQIIPYIVILILFFIIFQMYQNGKNEVEYNKRTDSLETANKKLEKVSDSLKVELTKYETGITVNEAGTEQQEKVYKKTKEKIKQQTSNEDYNNIIQYLNNYGK